MRLSILIALGLALAAVRLLGAPAAAFASWGQVPIIEDDAHLRADPLLTLERFRLLGAGAVRVFVPWSMIAPDSRSRRRPSRFDAADPGAYPEANWAIWDAIVRDAKLEGIAVDLTVAGGAPRWADGRGMPGPAAANPNRAWYPSTREYGLFVRALGTRYSGDYDPGTSSLRPGDPSDLPRVGFWAIWNEPNFGEDLAPQAIDGSSVSVAPAIYRGLVDQAWSALQATGHGHDTILIGGLTAGGSSGPVTRSHPQGLPGNFAMTRPLRFIRTLYCVDSSHHPLRGGAASALGCPTTAAGSRRFRAKHPGLFEASGFGQHPYPRNLPPTEEDSSDPDFASFPQLPNLERELDRLQQTYSSRTRYPIYIDEYGYITNPPDPGFVSPATAAYYLNWAEYLSWRSARIKSIMQYLLYDPKPSAVGDFASALLTPNGTKKPAYDAYRLPLFLPLTSTRKGRSLELWGAVRPARYATLDTHAPQTAQIQLQRGSRGTFTTQQTVTITAPTGYFDVHLKLPASGTIRLAWTYPPTDPSFPSSTAGITVYSRNVPITIR